MTLKLTWKQVDKYIDLCERWDEAPQLQDMDYSLVKEEQADSMGGWYGPGDEYKPGRMYIVIQPDGHSHS